MVLNFFNSAINLTIFLKILEGGLEMLKVDKKEFIDGLSVVGKVVRTTPTMPILSNVKIEVKDGRGKIIGTDLEIGIIYYFNCEGEDTEFLVSERIIEDIVKSFSDETFIIDVNEGFIEIKSKNNLYKVRTVDDEFPFINIENIDKRIDFKTEYIKKGLRKINFAIGLPERTRIEFTSALFEIKEDVVKIVGTDGNRLALYKNGDFKRDESEFEFLVPKQSISMLINVLSFEKKDTITFGFSGKSFYYEGDRIYFISRLGQGKFPDYEMVLPKENSDFVILNREELIKALSRINLITREGTGKVTFEKVDDTLKLYGFSTEIGEGVENIGIFEGNLKNGVKIFFDTKRLIEGLKYIDDERVKMLVFDPEAPITFKGLKDENFFYIIMPYRSE